jgi:hypothetical protein
MKTITTALLFFIQTAFIGAFSPTPFPNDRLEVSRVSDHILLVEVTGIATETKEDSGLKTTIYRVSGKVIEVLRGERPKNWSHTASDSEVTDMDTAKKALGDEGAELLSFGREFKREGSQCAVSERYLAIYWRECAFFVHVPKADTEWRSKIRPREAADEIEAQSNPRE